MATDQEREQITLHLDGSRATRGVTLSDFETFIDHFLAALRDFDRDRRGAEVRKGGRPEGRASLVTAFRLVAFREGSGIATLEPEVEEGGARLFDERPPQLENLEALIEDFEANRLPSVVADSLDKACGALGQDGSIEIEPEGLQLREPVRIDHDRLEEAAPAEPEDGATVEAISGKLHLIDLEPDKLAVRASDGTDWICEYQPELEAKVLGFVGEVVWVRGEGRFVSPKRGTMVVHEIRAVRAGNQAAFFSREQKPEDELMRDQGIVAAQGLERVGGEGLDLEADLAYLEALDSA